MDMGNFGFPNMMFSFPNRNNNSSEDSDSDTPYCYEENSDSNVSSTCSEDSDTSSEDEVNAVGIDSVINVPEKKYHACFKLTLTDIRKIEMVLDLSDYISIIFLLFDTSEMVEYALQKIRSMIAAGPEMFSRDILSEWARTPPKNWNFKLLEALAIIQNHQVLMELGFCKKDIIAMSDAPQNISRIKKVLFSSVCDYLRREQAEELINRVRNDVRFENDITLHCDPMYIEFHFLFWMSQLYIDIEKEPYLKHLTDHLKVMGLLDLVHKINEEVKGTSNTSKKSDRYITSNMDDDEDCYKIKDPNNPGLLVIINNANFKGNVERRKQFQSKITMGLADRLGSEKDVKSLKKTFLGLKYKVVIKNDIFHDEMVNEICDSVRNNFELGRHSVLVLCVLSHGDKGVVFGANSVPIRNKEIINSVSILIDLLAGIPKVFIFQACQGKSVLYVEPAPELLVPDGAGPGSTTVADGDDLKLDGPESCDPEAMKDKVVCMATIKGFVALRSYVNGTKYIQELCSCIKKYHAKKHFLEIITVLTKNLSSEKCIVKEVHEKRRICMVPEINHTSLCKLLYLTPKQATTRHHSAL